MQLYSSAIPIGVMAATIVELNFDRRLEVVTAGLPGEFSGLLQNKISREDALTIMDYMISLNAEVNPSVNYRKDIIRCLTKFCHYKQPFCPKDRANLKQLDRKDVLAFLDSLRKSEIADPLHKWIGFYNLYRVHLTRFFKWLYSPDVEPDKRPKPPVVDNIPQLRRKEKSIYKPTDMWTPEDDLYIFFERRWIITINFHNQKFQENVRRRIKNLQQQVMKTLESKLQPSGNKNDRKGQMAPQMCEVIYRLAIEESIASYYPIVDKTNKQLEQIEESILNASISKTQLSNIISLRRKISFLEGTLGMVSRAFDDIIRSGGGILEQTKLSRDSRRQIRSLNDKVTYLRRDIENMHQRVIGLREAYNSSLTANLNETIRTLTVIATIVLPLTLISGIYGMNFDVMPELRSPYGYYFALGLMAAVGGGMIGYFKRKRWI